MIAAVVLAVSGRGRVIRPMMIGRSGGGVLDRPGVIRRAGPHVAMKHDDLGPRKGQKTKESYGPAHRERLSDGLPGVKQAGRVRAGTPSPAR